MSTAEERAARKKERQERRRRERLVKKHEREAAAREAFYQYAGAVQAGTPTEAFLGLLLKVKGGEVWTAGSPLIRGEYIGPLAGAWAEVTDGTRVHRVAGAVVGTALVGPPGALVGLSTKAQATAFIHFRSGAIHQIELRSSSQVRRAQADVVQFNHLAANAQP
jgi:hypothetical protein